MHEIARVLIETAVAWEEQGALARFRRALRRRDQLVLDHLLKNLPELDGALPMQEVTVEAALLRLLVEEQKELYRIQAGLRSLAAADEQDG